MKKLLIPLVFVIVSSCNRHPIINQSVTPKDSIKSENSPSLDSTYKSYKSLDFSKSEDINDTSHYFLVNQACALYIQPDTSWINAQQRSMPEDEWNTIVDDHQYYQNNAEDTLKAHGIKVIYKDNDKRYLKFVKRNSQVYTLDKQKMKDAWGLILFNGVNNPVLWGSTEINDAVNDIYMKQNTVPNKR